uniref:Uncharacterized protein n=1 Tax=Ditylenchus dipsaci TaxID=166011 RepID=A0A915CW27_9BILA
MIFAAFLFVLAANGNKKQPPQGNVFGEVYRTAKTSLKNRSHAICQKDEKCLCCRKKGETQLNVKKKKFIEDINHYYGFCHYLPPIASCFVKLTPLRKMVAGGVVLQCFRCLGCSPNESQYYLTRITRARKSIHLHNDTLLMTAQSTPLYLNQLAFPGFCPQFLATPQSLTNNRVIDQTQLFDVHAGAVSFSLAYNGSDCGAIKTLPSTVTYEVEE